MTRPDIRQDGFLPVLTRDQIARELQHRVVQRDAAVVLIGYSYSGTQLAALANDWKQLLADLGFKRVVLLRGGGKKIEGLPVIEDAAVSSANVTQGRAATLAALPPAPEMDAGQSPTPEMR